LTEAFTECFDTFYGFDNVQTTFSGLICHPACVVFIEMHLWTFPNFSLGFFMQHVFALYFFVNFRVHAERETVKSLPLIF